MSEKEVNLISMLLETLKEAEAHLDYCGYGDAWERECAEHDNLPKKIASAIVEAERWEKENGQ